MSTPNMRQKTKGNLILVDDDGGQWCPHCGGFLLDGIDARSLDHLKLFHAFIRHLRRNWPEGHAFQPEGATARDQERHLRAWLTVAAKHVQPSHHHTWNDEAGRELTLRILHNEMEVDRKLGRYGWPRIQDNGITIYRPKSIAIYGPHKIGQEEFNEVTRDVFDVAYNATGIDVEDWRQNSPRGGR